MVKTADQKMMGIDKLKPQGRNVKNHPPEQIEALMKIMKNPKIGFNQPIVIDRKNNIWAGHGRLEAARKLGMREVPVVYLGNLTEDEKKAYMIMENKINESPWNRENLELVLSEIEFDFNPYQMTFDDILGLESDKVREEKDDVPEAPKIPKSEIGQVFKLGNHRVMCGDSAKDLFKLLKGVKINLITTDPPYNASYDQGRYTGQRPKNRFGPILNDSQTKEQFQEFITGIFNELKKYSESASLYVFSSSVVDAYKIPIGIIDAGWHIQSQIVWEKEQFVLSRSDYHWRHEIIWYGYDKNGKHYWCGDRTQDTIWKVSRVKTTEYKHPTQKPVELFRRAIRNSSRRGSNILDPFMGSGGSLIAAEQLGRTFYGIELDPRYVDVCIQRWENFTGKKAELIP